MAPCLRIIFAGTPDFAACHLRALLSSQNKIVGVFTQPDRPAGRGNKIIFSPVKKLALQHNIPVFQPDSLRRIENQSDIANLQPDIMVVVAYGLILPKEILSIPRLGCINVHASLLPRWRGAAPIERALCAGDKESGITIMQMDSGLDTGPMLYKSPCNINSDDTSSALYTRLSLLGPPSLLCTLEQLATGNITREAQDEQQATYAKKLIRQEAKLDWTLPAVQLERCIRAFNPRPTSYFIYKGKPIKVWQAQVLPCQTKTAMPGTIIAVDKQGIQIATADDVLNITQLQLPGKTIMPAADILNACARHSWFITGSLLN